MKYQCDECGIEFRRKPCLSKGEHHFCSRHCSITYTGKKSHHSGWINKRRPKIKVNCYLCDKTHYIINWSKQFKRHFCCKQCYMQWFIYWRNGLWKDL